MREHELCDLDRVQGRALAEVVAAREEQELVVVALRPADPADERVVDARGLEGARVDVVGRVVAELSAGS